MQDRLENRGRHTPGPWIAHKPQSDGQVPVVASAGGCPDAVIAVVGYDCPERSIEANARLIAAAPELLASLRRIEATFQTVYGDADSHLVGMSGGQSDPKTMRGHVLAAIAKAEGGAA